MFKAPHGSGKGAYKPLNKDVELTDLRPVEEGTVAIKPAEPKKATLTLFELLRVLWPYFWPAAGSDGAVTNRLRSSTTWLMVILSKGCNLLAPFYISASANELVAGRLFSASQSMIVYCVLRFMSSVFREMQSILYIKVKQQASIQLQEQTFTHLHSLSLNWHLSKKTGSVMKSMDRGVDAANSLVTYLFLFLIPAMAECLAVAILFFAKYSQWQLGVLVVVGVALYTIVTIAITEWRKKYREQTNKHDNDYHDKATDSIINYETVKYFTGEAFEIQRFTKSVVQFQLHSSNTQFSLNVLNMSQQVRSNVLLSICYKSVPNVRFTSYGSLS
jgi:ABC-type multidrug transport system fused ATPase/permease subunit